MFSNLCLKSPFFGYLREISDSPTALALGFQSINKWFILSCCPNPDGWFRTVPIDCAYGLNKLLRGETISLKPDYHYTKIFWTPRDPILGTQHFSHAVMQLPKRHIRHWDQNPILTMFCSKNKVSCLKINIF